MRPLFPLVAILFAGACSAPRSYTRPTPQPLPAVFDCARVQMLEMEYEIVLADTVGGLLQGQRQITGITEAARRGAAVATDILTVGLAGGNRTRFDELTVFLYTRRYPQGNTLQATAGLLTVEDDDQRVRSRPTDEARQDARRVADACAPRG